MARVKSKGLSIGWRLQPEIKGGILRAKTGAVKSVIRADYLRWKGLKFRDEVIPMQHYREQLRKALGDRWTPEADKLFVSKVKEYRSGST